MVKEGAGIIDIGGESTRPGAPEVSAEDELNRVIPVIEALSGNIDVPISIDTSKPIVMEKAFNAGASIINDVNALRSRGCCANGRFFTGGCMFDAYARQPKDDAKKSYIR